MKRTIKGNIVDIHRRRIYPGRIFIKDGRIESLEESDSEEERYILPGFVDAHVHIESSLVTPVEYARMVVRHGTVSAICDPHEIGNVLGKEGVRFMVENGKSTPFKFLFGAPSCVPATKYETAGAEIDSKDLDDLLNSEGVGFLAEMMNYPGVIHNDAEVLRKLNTAKKKKVPIDGHAPGVSGEELKNYVKAGISTDHECTTAGEALEKISLGMKILIREGSGAKNFTALIPLMATSPESLMFCTDDCHPDELSKGHINQIIKRAVSSGYDLFNVLRAASLNAVLHYGLDMGVMRPGDRADFIVVDDLDNWNVLATYINGEPVFNNGITTISSAETVKINRFAKRSIQPLQLRVNRQPGKMWLMIARDGDLATGRELIDVEGSEDEVKSKVEADRLKIAVINRYNETAKPALGFVKGFGLKRGAVASSIAHDSHHIICTGTDDRAMTEAINWIFEHRGGLAVHDGRQVHGLSLPVAGLMSDLPVSEAGRIYENLNRKAQCIGSSMSAPLITLSFMSLLVIPSLKIGDRGLFDVDEFKPVSLFESGQ